MSRDDLLAGLLILLAVLFLFAAMGSFDWVFDYPMDRIFSR